MKNLVITLFSVFLIIAIPASSIAQSKEEKKAQIEQAKIELRFALNDENASVDFLKSEVKRVEALNLKTARLNS